MIKILMLYCFIVFSIGSLLYGIPAIREIAIIHKTKVALSIGIGAILMIIIYLGEQIQ